MLTLKDKLLLFLDLLSDQEMFQPRRFVCASFGSGRVSAVERRIRQLAREGRIEVAVNDRDSELRLKVPLEEFWQARVFDLARFKRTWSWDGLWRVVLFDIREQDRNLRNIIRRKLKMLGFGMFQKSVWITPFDVANDVAGFLSKSGVKGPVEVFEGRRLFVEDEKALVAKIWNLNKINSDYLRLLAKDSFTFTDWLDVKSQDPCLPVQLLPDPWYESQALELLRKGYNQRIDRNC